MLGPKGDQGEQPEQGWRGPSYSRIGPLALGFDAEVSANFGEGHFRRPAANEPAKDVERVGIEVGAQERLRTEFAFDIADQHVQVRVLPLARDDRAPLPSHELLAFQRVERGFGFSY